MINRKRTLNWNKVIHYCDKLGINVENVYHDGELVAFVIYFNKYFQFTISKYRSSIWLIDDVSGKTLHLGDISENLNTGDSCIGEVIYSVRNKYGKKIATKLEEAFDHFDMIIDKGIKAETTGKEIKPEAFPLELIINHFENLLYYDK